MSGCPLVSLVFGKNLSGSAEGRGKGLMDAFHVDELVSAFLVRDEDKFIRQFCRGEGGCVSI